MDWPHWQAHDSESDDSDPVTNSDSESSPAVGGQVSSESDDS